MKELFKDSKWLFMADINLFDLNIKIITIVFLTPKGTVKYYNPSRHD